MAAAALLPGAVLERLASEPAELSGVLHFALVLAAGTVAAAASVALTVAGARRGDGAPSCSGPRSRR
jgi:hypothetical protein